MNPAVRGRRAVFFLAALLLATSASAQDKAKLKSTRTFRCLFVRGATGDMDGDQPLVRPNADSLELIFDQVDAQNGTGRIVGNAGGGDVTVIIGAESISILEATLFGTLQVTVVYMAQRSDGQFKAVHSRHTAMTGGIPIASQTYGTCRPLL